MLIIALYASLHSLTCQWGARRLIIDTIPARIIFSSSTIIIFGTQFAFFPQIFHSDLYRSSLAGLTGQGQTVSLAEVVTDPVEYIFQPDMNLVLCLVGIRQQLRLNIPLLHLIQTDAVIGDSNDDIMIRD